MLDNHQQWQLMAPIGSSIVAERPVPRHRILEAVLDATARGRNAVGILVAAALAVCAWPVSVTMPYWLVGIGTAHYVASVTVDVLRAERRVRDGQPFTIPLRVEVEPAEIVAHDLRVAYQAILASHEELRLALVAAPSLQPHLRAAFERCASMVHRAGRLALLGNPIHRYDSVHDRQRLLQEQHAAIAHAEATTDTQAARVYRDVADTRQRQLETYDRLHDLRDRICARLDLVRATIDNAVTSTVKLAVLDREQCEVTDEPLSMQLQCVSDELAVLESSLDEDLAA